MPKCDTCDNEATCFGAYEGQQISTYGCDDCCGHGDEDGSCEILAEGEGCDADD